VRVNRLIKVAGAAVVAALCLPVALGAQTAQSLGSITLAKSVMADGQPLAAGQQCGQGERPFAAGGGIHVDEAVGAGLEHGDQSSIRINGTRNSTATNAATDRPLRVAPRAIPSTSLSNA